jgi:predicted RNase H-like HicB family nuclease
MKFRVVLEYDAEAKAFSAVCPELPGCASAGDTEEEARRNIKEAIELYLKGRQKSLPAFRHLDGEGTRTLGAVVHGSRAPACS